MFLFFISCVKKCNWNISVKEKNKIISFEYEEYAVLFMISKCMNKNVIYCIIFITVQKLLCHYSYAEKWSIFTVLNI